MNTNKRYCEIEGSVVKELNYCEVAMKEFQEMIDKKVDKDGREEAYRWYQEYMLNSLETKLRHFFLQDIKNSITSYFMREAEGFDVTFSEDHQMIWIERYGTRLSEPVALNPYFHAYVTGYGNMNDILRHLAEEIEDSLIIVKDQAAKDTLAKQVKENIFFFFPKLADDVPEDFLQKYPGRLLGKYVVSYRYIVDYYDYKIDADTKKSIMVTTDCLNEIGLTEADLFEAAKENYSRYFSIMMNTILRISPGQYTEIFSVEARTQSSGFYFMATDMLSHPEKVKGCPEYYKEEFESLRTYGSSKLYLMEVSPKDVLVMDSHAMLSKVLAFMISDAISNIDKDKDISMRASINDFIGTKTYIYRKLGEELSLCTEDDIRKLIGDFKTS